MAVYKQHDIGQRAEKKARTYLEAQGLSFIKQNYRCYHGEIDLIMRDKDIIVFTEVRYRSINNFGTALESITQSKIKKLTKAAIHYLQYTNALYQVTSRFDVIAIHPIAGKMTLEWFKNAFTIESYA